MVLVGHPDDLPDLLAGALDAVVDQDAVVLVRRQQAVAVLVRPLQNRVKQVIIDVILE